MSPPRSAFGAPPQGGATSGPAKPVPRRPLGQGGSATDGGFTLVEVAIALAITALLAAMAVPTFASLVARQRLQAAVEHLRADIALARQEAGRRALPVRLVFHTGSRWCYAIGTAPALDCRPGEPADPARGVIKVVQGSDQPGVQLLLATPMVVDSRTGGSPGGGGLARFASAEGQQLQVSLGHLGHASVCAPAATVAGAAPCLVPRSGP